MSLFNRRAASPADPNVPSLFDRQNVVRGVVTATLSAGALACILLAPRYPILCAIAGLWIAAFAASVNIALVKPSVIVPTLHITGDGVRVEQVPPLERVAETHTNGILTDVPGATVKVTKIKSSVPATQ